MTSTRHGGIYVFGKPKPNATPQPKVDAKRIAEAKKNVEKYMKK